MRIRRAAALLGGLAVLATTAGCGPDERADDRADDRAGDPAGEAPVDRPPLTLQLPAGGDARCARPTVERLSAADVAFDADATGVSATEVTFTVRGWYAGSKEDTATDRVVMSTVNGSRVLELVPEFAEGDRYLVSASGTQVSVCGLSDEWTEKLAGTFREAFGEPTSP